MPPSTSARFQDLADPALRRGIEQMIRARVPSGEVDDLVQATLTDALASASMPDKAEEVRRWVFGIAKHKIVDFYRRSRREQPGAVPEIPVSGAPHAAQDMLHWAEKELADNAQGDETLEWMLREGDGEKLENIAADERVPAPRVRQRVSRWRKHLRERWAAELAAVAALAVVVGALWWAWRYRSEHAIVQVTPDNSAVRPTDAASLRAAELRARALQACEQQAWQACLADLDEAAGLDPEGDRAERVVRARQGAADALRGPQAPAPSAVPNNVAPRPTQGPPVPTEAPPRVKTGPDAKKMEPPRKNAPAPSDLNEKDYNVAPVDTAPPTQKAPEPQPPPQTKSTEQQQQLPMQQQAPNKTKGGKPTSTSKEGSSYDWGSAK